MKNILTILILSISLSTFAQTGIGTTTPNASARLDVSANNKGFLPPRMALTSTTLPAPLASHVAGMVIYNTATTGDVSPGLYVNNGTLWVFLPPKKIITGTVIGQMQYWNGTEWTVVAATVNQSATLKMISGVPTWTGGTPPAVPGAPTSVTAIAGNTPPVVTFTAPADDGGSAITGYTVTSDPGGVTANGASSPITITGLPDGTYTFTVTATNANGTSIASTPSNSVTYITVPNAPTLVTATAGNTNATVTFTIPSNNGGSAITGYTVTSNTGGFIINGASSPITIPGLANGITYTFTVTATTILGTGSPSIASNKVTLDVLIAGTNSYPVYNPDTDEIWMDRNLGATQVATSSTDAASYGSLYQWGRGTDGHQITSSVTTTNLSSNDNPGHSNFIINSVSPSDWRSPQNSNLWQGVNGINNPCPTGYRIPTAEELEAERLSWSTSNAAGAFGSPLKLPMAGRRLREAGELNSFGVDGYYWSSSTESSGTRLLIFGQGASVPTGGNGRIYGISVRCIKD